MVKKKFKMRILQLIDSLETGGAERMAVNYANALIDEVSFSGLVSSRKEGGLINQLDNRVEYLFLNRRGIFDFKAILKFRKYIKVHNVSIIHAHSTSFFLAVLMKIIGLKVNIVWHDHNGNRILNNRNQNNILKVCSLFFNGIIVVNDDLAKWARENLFTRNVTYLPNFTTENKNEIPVTILNGISEKRIVCLANLRNPKNHITLFIAFLQSKIFNLGWSLHCIGKDGNDIYSNELKQYIVDNKLEDFIFIYGSCTDIFNIQSQANIGILCSTHEGFPVTLLEYGLSELAVIATNVGYCPFIIENNERGILVDPLKTSEICEALIRVTTDKEFANDVAHNLNVFVKSDYSQKAIIQKAINKYNTL
jgi:glycosyltransferase involved in cell wall biosynthesis